MRRGPVLMIVAGLFFTVMIALVKLAREEMGALDLMFWRGATAVPLVALLVRPGRWRLHRPGLFAVRAAFGSVAMLSYFTAAHGLAVADLSLISKLQPVVVAVIAGVLLGEGMSRRTVWSMALGLAGCVLILAPGLAVGSVYGLYALTATLASACGHVCIRVMMRTDDVAVVVLYFQGVAMVVAMTAVAITRSGLPAAPPSPALWGVVLAIGVCATAGQLLMTRAYSLDHAARVAAASYTAPLWAVIIDLLVFAALPTLWVIIGGGLIVLAGIAVLGSPGKSVASWRRSGQDETCTERRPAV